MSLINELKEISSRGKVAFSICCLENSLKHYQQYDKRWIFVLEKLWGFCNSNMAVWQENLGEITPFVVLEDIEFKEKDCQYLLKKEHDSLRDLYRNSDPVILNIITLIYEVGITNVLVKINNDSLKLAPVPYIVEIIELMDRNNVSLPDIKLFKKFPITENNGWGRNFTRDDVF